MRNVPRVLDQLRRKLNREQSLLRSTVEGETWVRRAASPADPSGDGHVTPSFEVLLGPGASLDIVAAIGLGRELMGLDRVLTFRITPESVAAGLGCGLDPARLLEGQRQVLLAEDVDTGDDRAIPLRTIASVLAVYES
jgi:hypothetical protein